MTNKDEVQQLAQQGRVNKQATISLMGTRTSKVRRSAALAAYRLDWAVLVAAVITTNTVISAQFL